MNACIPVKMACVDNYVAILIPKTVFNYLAKSRFRRCGYCPTMQVLAFICYFLFRFFKSSCFDMEMRFHQALFFNETF